MGAWRTERLWRGGNGSSEEQRQLAHTQRRARHASQGGGPNKSFWVAAEPVAVTDEEETAYTLAGTVTVAMTATAPVPVAATVRGVRSRRTWAMNLSLKSRLISLSCESDKLLHGPSQKTSNGNKGSEQLRLSAALAASVWEICEMICSAQASLPVAMT